MHEATARQLAEEGLREQAARVLGMPERSLHAVDMDDLVLSTDVMRSLSQVAADILKRHIPHPSEIPQRIEGVLDALQEEAYWSESTRELILCVEIGGDAHYVQVPPGHWKVHSRPAD
jgi:hypothetical protein